MPQVNDLQFLREVLQRLRASKVQAWVFGGWAEELRGLRPPGPHHDIDLLYLAVDFQAVDQFLNVSGLEEIRAKRFAHKRAFLVSDIIVELLLVQSRDGRCYNHFFSGDYVFEWPGDTFKELHSGGGDALPVASRTALWCYHRQHERIEQAYLAYRE